MPKDNVSRYAILGILSIRPMSGYDMKNWINYGIGYFCDISYGQIYPNLKNMAAEGLVTFTTERNESRPEKRIYTLTGDGMEVLKEWLSRPIDYNARSQNNILLLKIFFGACVPVEVTINHIKGYRDSLRKELEQISALDREMTLYREQAAEISDLSIPYRAFTMKRGIKEINSLIDWCDETVNEMEAWGGKIKLR